MNFYQCDKLLQDKKESIVVYFTQQRVIYRSNLSSIPLSTTSINGLNNLQKL